MKEVEVKAKVSDFGPIERKLVDLGCEISEIMTDKDKVFVNTDDDFAELKVGNSTNFVRIRDRDGLITLTLKRPLTGELDCIEKEIEISDARVMEEMLELFGYHKAVEFSKKRRKSKYKSYEICLDEFEEMGNFIEVEEMTEKEDSGAVQKELFEFLKSLGIDEKDRVANGYDTLIYLNQKK